MKFVILAAVLATAYGGIIAPVAYTVPFAAPIAVSSQYHAQDTLGQYNYGYINGLSSKAEVKSVDGITRGGYTYVDAEGKLQSVQYTSDSANGFRVAATNLPVAPPAPKVCSYYYCCFSVTLALCCRLNPSLNPFRCKTPPKSPPKRQSTWRRWKKPR